MREMVNSADEDDKGTPKNPVTIDQAMDMSGSLLRVQLFYQIYFTFILGFCFYQATVTVFTGDSPSWICLESSSSDFCRQNLGLQIESTNLNFSKRCDLKRSEWDYTKPKSYSYVTQFDLVCQKNYLSALIGGSFFIGLVISSVACGTISDIYGRKKIYFCFLLLNVSMSIACSFVNDPWLLFAFRFVLGLASSAGWGLSFVYLAELIPPKRRTMCMAGANIAFPLSALLAVGVAFIKPNWQKLQLYLSLPGVLAIFALFVLPESPYWLMSAGKPKDAETIVRSIARMNGKIFDTGTELMSKQTKSDPTSDGKKYTYIDLCRHLKVVLLVAAINLLWFSIALSYFTITFQVSNLGGNIYTSFVLITIPDIPSTFLPIYLCDRFGRKKTILLGLIISGVISSIIALVTWKFTSVYLLNIILSFCGKLSLNVAYNGMCLWQFELYPTVLRSQGSSVGTIAENTGSALAPLLSEVLHDVNPALPYMVMGVFGILAPLLGLVLPETKGRPTREHYSDFFMKISEDVQSVETIEMEGALATTGV